MVAVIAVLAVVALGQMLLTYRQMQHFSKEFADLRRRGKVAVGRKSGGFYAGAIVMLRVDDKGLVQEGKVLEGTTAFARIKDLPGYEGRDIRTLTREDAPKGHRNLGRALEDAAKTFSYFEEGKAAPAPASPAVNLKAALGSLVGGGRLNKGTKLQES